MWHVLVGVAVAVTFAYTDPCRVGVVANPAARQGVLVSELTRSAAGLRLRASTAVRRVRLGDKVEARLAIINDTSHPVAVGTGAGLYGEVRTREGKFVWDNLPIPPEGADIATPLIQCYRTVLPKRPFEFAITWGLTDKKGHPVPPGEYVVRMTISTEPRLRQARALRITVLPHG